MMQDLLWKVDSRSGSFIERTRRFSTLFTRCIILSCIFVSQMNSIHVLAPYFY